ncbi:LrgB family protein [Microbacterium halophytorum]|uniref:LrgB family protein n=1 Tax=Microbacterium halophytorum TaxID=2067568 RepID=UPI001319DCBF|nr:LrgB family protein [Microbacterium halophytorum]
MIWLAVTLLIWAGASALARVGRGWLNPVLVSTIAIAALLIIRNVPLAEYQEGTIPLTALLAPAIVALALPIRRHGGELGRLLPALIVAAVAGTVVGLAVTVAVAWALGAPPDVLLALAPKHATSAVSAAVAEVVGADVALAAVFSIITGILGAVAGPPLLRLLRRRDPVSQGFAIGLSAHAIGTARAMELGPTTGASSALGLALAALLVPLAVLVGSLLGWL